MVDKVAIKLHKMITGKIKTSTTKVYLPHFVYVLVFSLKEFPYLIK